MVLRAGQQPGLSLHQAVDPKESVLVQTPEECLDSLARWNQNPIRILSAPCMDTQIAVVLALMLKTVACSRYQSRLMCETHVSPIIVCLLLT
jgi:hypothetical protein